MFILVPLVLLVGSLAGIFLISQRKFIYLKKLAPEVIEESTVADGSFWQIFFGELLDYIRTIQVRENLIKFLAEIEKALRQLRLISLKIESLMYSLIVKVRTQAKRHEEKLNQEASAPSQEELRDESGLDPTTNSNIIFENDDRFWREEEQRLIMSIAKSPREAELYKQLGSVYMQTKEWDDARQSFEKALELDPEDYITKTKLARVLHQIKNLASRIGA